MVGVFCALNLVCLSLSFFLFSCPNEAITHPDVFPSISFFSPFLLSPSIPRCMHIYSSCGTHAGLLVLPTIPLLEPVLPATGSRSLYEELISRFPKPAPPAAIDVRLKWFFSPSVAVCFTALLPTSGGVWVFFCFCHYTRTHTQTLDMEIRREGLRRIPRYLCLVRGPSVCVCVSCTARPNPTSIHPSIHWNVSHAGSVQFSGPLKQ